jgi:predicted nuclease of restriction endonuclease-like (RecB) superfamily
MHQRLSLYQVLLTSIKNRICCTQNDTAFSTNAALLTKYWDVGRIISTRQELAGRKESTIRRLAFDLKNQLPNEKGFSERNILRMIEFWSAYPQLFTVEPWPQADLGSAGSTPKISQPALTDLPLAASFKLSTLAETTPFFRDLIQLSWGHNVILIQKVSHLITRAWYARQALDFDWSRDTLRHQINHRAHERENQVSKNAATAPQDIPTCIGQASPKAFDLLKYLMSKGHSRDADYTLETKLVSLVAKFFMELRRGFAFVGNQYRLDTGPRRRPPDLLFYHLHLRCFVVVDLNKGAFESESAADMHLYCSTVDSQLGRAGDPPSIGLILCQTNDRIIAKYSLKSRNQGSGVAHYQHTRFLPSEFAASLPSVEQIEWELWQNL